MKSLSQQRRAFRAKQAKAAREWQAYCNSKKDKAKARTSWSVRNVMAHR